MTVHMDVTLPKMPCAWLSVDAMDVTGESHLEIHDHGVTLQRLDRRGEPRRNTNAESHEFGPKQGELPAQAGEVDPDYCGDCYGAQSDENKCCNTCAEVREAYKKKNWGMPDVNTVGHCCSKPGTGMGRGYAT